MNRDQLFENNLPLVYYYYRRFKKGYKNKEEMEEFIQYLRIGLWKASKTYNREGNNTFANWAIKIMKNEDRMYWRERYTKTRQEDRKCRSAYEMVDVSEHLTVLDCIPDNMSVEDEAIMRIQFETLDEKERELIKLYSQYDQEKDIAEFLGCHRTNINKRKKAIIRKLVG